MHYYRYLECSVRSKISVPEHTPLEELSSPVGENDSFALWCGITHFTPVALNDTKLKCSKLQHIFRHSSDRIMEAVGTESTRSFEFDAGVHGGICGELDVNLIRVWIRRDGQMLRRVSRTMTRNGAKIIALAAAGWLKSQHRITVLPFCFHCVYPVIEPKLDVLVLILFR